MSRSMLRPRFAKPAIEPMEQLPELPGLGPAVSMGRLTFLVLLVLTGCQAASLIPSPGPDPTKTQIAAPSPAPAHATPAHPSPPLSQRVGKDLDAAADALDHAREIVDRKLAPTAPQ